MALADLLRSLIEQEPRTLDELEAIVGPIGSVMWMCVSMPVTLPPLVGGPAGWPGDVVCIYVALGLEDRQVDIHHQDPYVRLPPDYAFRAYRAYALRGGDEAETLLRARCGGRVVFGRFVLERFGAERFSLGWHRDDGAMIDTCRFGPAPPGFSDVPPTPPKQPALIARTPTPLPSTHSSETRRAFLAELLRSLHDFRTPDDFGRFFAAIPPDTGVTPLTGSLARAGASAPTTLHGLAFEPPEDAHTLCALLGLARPCAFSVDVHMSSYRMAEAHEMRVGEVRYVAPRFPTVARFEIDVTVEVDGRTATRIETGPAVSAYELEAGTPATVPRLYIKPPW